MHGKEQKNIGQSDLANCEDQTSLPFELGLQFLQYFLPIYGK